MRLPANRNVLPFLILFPALILLQEPFAPFANQDAAYDLGVFTYAAKAILHGDLIYREVFDHKGPLLYLLNVIGLLIGNGNPVGIWVVDVAFLSAATVIMYRTARLFAETLPAFLATIYALLALAVLDPGDGTQFYALPFMAASLHIFARNLLQQREFSSGDLVVVAASFAATLLLQPNLVVIWVVFGAEAVLSLMAAGQYRRLSNMALMAAVAVAATLLPFLAYAAVNGILTDAVACYWTFNRQYAQPGAATILSGLRYAVGNLSRASALIVFLSYLADLLLRRARLHSPRVHLWIIPAIAATLVSSALSGRNYPHYCIVMVPLLVVAAAYCFNSLHASPRMGRTVLALVWLAVCARPAARQGYSMYVAYHPQPRPAQLVFAIRDNTLPQDTIAVVGNDSQLYYRSDRRSSSKYHYTSPLFDVSGIGEEMARRYQEDLLATKPKLVIVQKLNYPQGAWFVSDMLKRYYAEIPSPDPDVTIFKRVPAAT